MTLSQIKALLPTLSKIVFIQDNGTKVPEHVHLTEIGVIQKHFIDCGGTIRKEEKISFQLWYAQDVDHRLSPEKLRSIITLSEQTLGITDGEIEVAYQGDTIGLYQLSFDGVNFILKPTYTACLAQDACSKPTQKKSLSLSSIGLSSKGCSPDSGCC
jgi:hypothetical protein